ncbi:MAG: hypothetical protein R3F59_35275 [Myxococcota bacterium]
MRWMVLGLGLGLPAVAAADPLTFGPDRPGVGDSTTTPGRGHAIVEGGIAAAVGAGDVAVGTSSVTGRLGVDEGVELRLRLPDVTFADGWSAGTLGLGAKVGGELGERWSSSVVAEASIDPSGGPVGGSLGGNVAVALGDVGLWGHASAAGAAGPVAVLAGGGASVGFGPHGVFVNGGSVVGAGPFAGVGAWITPGDAVQVDVGCDVFWVGGAATATPAVGLAVGL